MAAVTAIPISPRCVASFRTRSRILLSTAALNMMELSRSNE
ncbi:hypothetical protein JMJ77_0008960 [Colletotrichum scovillei]|uniref:Uncharacterized protein n=1 Tax=Colletotrichum scovillei TaxID=1209932 RepID=A0A9P7QTN6_9PEZI|nr:hypothetical protein JMJ78_0001819 [Colletotrichum scovillei]KAG7041257.1 hypothetical protein JMJ77_0008960 [Colletotrichum scovillei]KAG7061288.1 hypothetical protein JMJ76_0010356 [Colletotrichum scovillei]